jgi:hypothetical protein
MVLSLLYGKNKYAKTQVSSNFGSVVFDTVTIEDHRYQARATQYPVEFGQGQLIISDHIFKQPEVVNISGIISDTPLSIFSTFNRSVAAFNQLVELFNRRLPVTLVTGIKVYTNMAIVTLDVPRNVKTGQTLTFNIEFQKIIFDDTVQVEINQGNVFEGVIDNTPRAIVAENTNIPVLQNDPPFSLKDQAESQVSVGVQSLATVPSAMLPQVLSTASILRGIA